MSKYVLCVCLCVSVCLMISLGFKVYVKTVLGELSECRITVDQTTRRSRLFTNSQALQSRD